MLKVFEGELNLNIELFVPVIVMYTTRVDKQVLPTTVILIIVAIFAFILFTKCVWKFTNIM